MDQLVVMRVGLQKAVTSFTQRVGTVGTLATGVVVLMGLNWAKKTYFRHAKAPPHVPSPIPFIGNVVAFGERPIDFLHECFLKFGPVFSFTMFGTEVTYLIGSEATTPFWSSHNDDLNAEDLYANITVPVFGKGIAYDVPHKIFLEQKQMAKAGLSQERFQTYTAIVEEECHKFLQRWVGQHGTTNLFVAMAEMIVFTATRCLHGKETRDAFNEEVAHLYHDLDGGFSPLAWFFPPWMPFPSFKKRDRAHLELKRRFFEVIEARRASGKLSGHDDMLETFLNFKYDKVNDSRALNNEEISGLLIALLMAGQHTSSTTSAWVGFYICSVPGLQQELYEEQLRVAKQFPGPLTLEAIDHMGLLHSCIRETLRLRPPIMTMMRKARKTFTVVAHGREYVIPAGNQVCVSPTVNGLVEEEWENARQFNPRRFLGSDGKVNDGGGQGGKFKWVPFGAGRHRCIGFEFAQIQIRCVLSTVIRNFILELPTGAVPAVNYRTMIHTPLDPQINYTRRPEFRV